MRLCVIERDWHVKYDTPPRRTVCLHHLGTVLEQLSSERMPRFIFMHATRRRGNVWKVTCRSQRVFTVMVFANILTCLQIVLTRGSGRGSKLFMYLEAGYEFIKDPSSSPPCRTYRKRSKRSYILRVYRLEAISTHSHDAKAVVVDSPWLAPFSQPPPR